MRRSLRLWPYWQTSPESFGLAQSQPKSAGAASPCPLVRRSCAGSHSDHIELFEKLPPLRRKGGMRGHEKADRVIAAADAAHLMEEGGDPRFAGAVWILFKIAHHSPIGQLCHWQTSPSWNC